MPRKGDPISKVMSDLSSPSTRSIWGNESTPCTQSTGLLDSIREILRSKPSYHHYPQAWKRMNEIPLDQYKSTAFTDIMHAMMFTPPFQYTDLGIYLLRYGIHYKYIQKKTAIEILKTSRALIQSELMQCSNSKVKQKKYQMLLGKIQSQLSGK